MKFDSNQDKALKRRKTLFNTVLFFLGYPLIASSSNSTYGIDFHLIQNKDDIV